MPLKLPKQPKRIGRPPAGAREGERVRVKDYPQLSVRLPVEIRLTSLKQMFYTSV